MRIALLTYRGNMFCGGQGVYAAALARGLHELGHDVHVIAGPPAPELAPANTINASPSQMNREVRINVRFIFIISYSSPCDGAVSGSRWATVRLRLVK